LMGGLDYSSGKGASPLPVCQTSYVRARARLARLYLEAVRKLQKNEEGEGIHFRRKEAPLRTAEIGTTMELTALGGGGGGGGGGGVGCGRGGVGGGGGGGGGGETLREGRTTLYLERTTYDNPRRGPQGGETRGDSGKEVGRERRHLRQIRQRPRARHSGALIKRSHCVRRRSGRDRHRGGTRKASILCLKPAPLQDLIGPRVPVDPALRIRRAAWGKEG